MLMGFPGGSVVKTLPANAGDADLQFQSLGQEEPLEEEMATHSSFFAWRIPWTEGPGGLQSMGLQSDATEQLTLSLFFPHFLHQWCVCVNLPVPPSHPFPHSVHTFVPHTGLTSCALAGCSREGFIIGECSTLMCCLLFWPEFSELRRQ